MSGKVVGEGPSATPAVKADLLSTVVHDAVWHTIQLCRLGVKWEAINRGVEALTFKKIVEVIEIEETQHHQRITAEWISGFGRVLRLMITSQGGLHRRYIDMYVGKGDIPAWYGDKVDAKVVEVLSTVWKLFELARNGPATLSVLVGGVAVRTPAKRPRNQTLSESLVFDYVQWQLTGKMSKQLKEHPQFRKSS